MNRNAFRCHLDHFRLDRRISWWNEEAEPGAPCHDDYSPPLRESSVPHRAQGRQRSLQLSVAADEVIE
jgi:hypothetical protein